MKKVLLSSLVALMAITTANAAGVSGIASTNYVDDAIGKIEIPDLKGDEKTIGVENETIKAITETGEIGTNATSLVTSGAVKTALDNKADKATTYTKTETDGLLDAKADKETTLSGYGITDAYTKTETDGLLGAKADKETTLSGYGITDAYTKTETDGLLDAKADKSDIVIKTHTSGSADTITVTDENNTVTVTANVDTTPTAGSAKLITSGAVKTALDTKADSTTTYTKTETDGLLGAKADKSDIVIKTHTSGSADTITVTDENNTVTVTANVDTAPTADSAKLITSGAVKTALDTKADQTAVDALATDAVRVDANKNMIVENNTDYGDCAVGDTCTLVAVRTASGMQSVWKKIFPAAAQ